MICASISGPIRRGDPVRLEDLKAGDGVVITSDEWGCVACGNVRRVKKGKLGLYVSCAEGMHYLDGQGDVDGGILVGIERLGGSKRA